jgi:hypothetical protein
MPVDAKPTGSICRERIRLSEVVVQEVQNVNDAKPALDRAVAAKEDPEPHIAELNEFRKAERRSVYALNAHRKKHGC